MSGVTCDSTSNIDQTKTDERKVWLEAILKRNCRDEKINKVVNYVTKSATAKGDNYTSDLIRIEMDVMSGSGKMKKVSVIVKELPSTELRRAMFSEFGFFTKEIGMYRSILPNMSELMNEFCDYSDPMWGKIYEYRAFDRLVLQDLTKLGYKIADRKQGLNYDHCLLVMKSLAKFHALSVILKSRRLIPMEIYDQGMLQHRVSKMQMKDVYQKLLMNLVKTVEHWGKEWQPAIEKIKAIVPNVMNTLNATIERDETKFNVLNHGDCWLNNIMFKYGIDSEMPISVKFVDYQLCFYNTPAYDLAYFLSTTPNLDVREKQTTELITEYHKSLTTFLKYYNYTGNIITMPQLLEELKRLSLIKLVNALLILPLILVETSEAAPDFEKLMKEHKENKNLDMQWMPSVGKNYTIYIQMILKEAIDNGHV